MFEKSQMKIARATLCSELGRTVYISGLKNTRGLCLLVELRHHRLKASFVGEREQQHVSVYICEKPFSPFSSNAGFPKNTECRCFLGLLKARS